MEVCTPPPPENMGSYHHLTVFYHKPTVNLVQWTPFFIMPRPVSKLNFGNSRRSHLENKSSSVTTDWMSSALAFGFSPCAETIVR